jgi:hypothetical protein
MRPSAASEPLSTWKPIALHARAQVSNQEAQVRRLMRPGALALDQEAERAGRFAAMGDPPARILTRAPRAPADERGSA